MALLKSACIVAILACLTVAALRYMDLVDSFSFTDIVQLVSRPGYEYIGVAWTTLLSAFSNVPDSKPSHPTETDKIFTKEELQSLKYSYLAIVGEVFDVQSGSKHYGTDGHYNFFTGIDGSKAYVTGDFTEKGLTDDIEGLDAAGIRGLEDWRLMYHKDYKYVGKVIGRFYDADGKETETKRAYNALLKDAEKLKLKKEKMMKSYPPCNSEFKHTGSRVWCSDMSGGVSRGWAGLPRKLFEPATGHHRCACVRTTGPPSSNMDSTTHENRGDLDNPNLREYDNCASTSESCPI